MSTTTDAITILTARGRRLAKRLHADGTIDGYDSARTLDGTTEVVDGLPGVLALLHRLLPQPDCCVIRGALPMGERVTGIRRLLHPDKDTGDAATIRDVPRCWLALDVEGVPLPVAAPASDLAACSAAALGMLPGAFQRAACIVQASASHGIKPDLRLRLWFWLDRPVWGHELKRWLKGTPADPSVFGAVQPIYTAAPVLMPGVTDPLPYRLLTVAGAALVQVPSEEALGPPKRSGAPLVISRRGRPSTLSCGPHPYVQAALARAAAQISNTDPGGRHPLIVAETCRLARFIDAGMLTADELTRVVRGAAEQAGKDDPSEVDDAIAWGLAHPWTDGPMPETHHGG